MWCNVSKHHDKFLYQSLYHPTNAHKVKNVELLKHIKIMEAAPTCLGLQRNHHQGARTVHNTRHTGHTMPP